MTTGPDPTARPSLNALIAAEIRAEMGRQGMVMTRLAEALGVSEAWTTRHLSARSSIQPLTFDELERIARALQVSYLDLIPEDFTPGNVASRAAIHSLTFDEIERIAGALGISHLDLLPKDAGPKADRNPPPREAHGHRPNPQRPRPPRPPKSQRTSVDAVAA